MIQAATEDGRQIEILSAVVRRALDRGIDYLLARQGVDGSWTDMWLAVGASDGWVTGFVGTALAEALGTGRGPAARIEAGVGRSCAWLEATLGRRGGWGYNGTLPPDADSTAWAVTCLALARHAIPGEPLTLLERARVAGHGTRTYLRAGHAWDQPLPDVAAASLRAAYEAGTVDRARLAGEWLRDVATSALDDGTWPAFWWTSSAYPTGIALDVWRLAGRPPIDRIPALPSLRAPSAFEQAWLVTTATAVEDPAWPRELRALLAMQDADGGWARGGFLVVPPSREPNADARRLLTTASAVMALVRAIRLLPALRNAAAVAPGMRARRSELGRAATRLIHDSAVAVGFPEPDATAAAEVFDTLTVETFAEPSPWPAPQLSSLGAGIPLELSVTAGPNVSPGLRYAVEVGHPTLNAQQRAAAAVEAVRRTAGVLGHEQAWQRVGPAVAIATDGRLAVRDGCRFWVWSGITQALEPSGTASPPRLKIYLSLLQAEVGGARARLEAILRAADIPLASPLRAGLDELDAAGFPHEIAFGLGPGGRIAAKLYYELSGWRPSHVASLLRMAALEGPGDDPVADLRPVIPGILGESLATRSRAGIALRVDPQTGAVLELTTAVAFPPPLVGNAEVSRRLVAWIERAGWRSEYTSVVRVLAPPAGDLRRDLASPLHSLMTRTVTSDAAWTTLYLRPGEERWTR